ncbi:hypothetical protein BLOT_005530 [Blomia tropicalis]|nr:hypothetical protein BLOT_005530 [Blomia tropicalis]
MVKVTERMVEEQTMEPLVQVDTGWMQHHAIFISCMFVIGAIVVKIIYHRNKRIAHLIPESCQTSTSLAKLKPTFNLEIFFAVLLPPIMLESAYSLNQKHFYLNIVPILLYAILGTMINIAMIGPSLYVMTQIISGGHNWLNIPPCSVLELTIFGASLSAIDPVSVCILHSKF